MCVCVCLPIEILLFSHVQNLPFRFHYKWNKIKGQAARKWNLKMNKNTQEWKLIPQHQIVFFLLLGMILHLGKKNIIALFIRFFGDEVGLRPRQESKWELRLYHYSSSVQFADAFQLSLWFWLLWYNMLPQLATCSHASCFKSLVGYYFSCSFTLWVTQTGKLALVLHNILLSLQTL